MVANDEYVPINCDDYDNLELACQHHLELKIKMKDGENIKGVAKDLQLKKKVEYLIIDIHGEEREIRLDYIINFSHPQIGTVVVSKAE